MCNPTEMTYEQIVSTGQKMCIGHSVCYLLSVSRYCFVAYPDTNSHYFEIYALAAWMFAIVSAVGGFSVIFH